MAASKIRSAVQVRPAGADGQVQFNDGGVMAGDSGLTFDKTTGKLTVSKVDSQGSVAGNIRTIDNGDSPYAVAADDYTILCDTTDGDVTVNLPAAASNNRRVLNIKKIDSSANDVIIDGNGAETIDGATTETLTKRWESVTIQCDGSAWYIL